MRSLRAAWDHGDFGSFEWAHPKIECVIVGGSSAGNWIGLDGMAEGWGANLFHLDGGKVTKLVLYLEHERALADIGLAE